VTVAEYGCYLRASGKTAPTDELDHPAVRVSWRDATAYAAWLAQLTGLPWRLPTEAEWEKAARYDPNTRTSRIYPWGDTFDKARCNTYESGIRGTTPVGTYPNGASPCGALDMAGNVWEWTSSLFKPYPYNASDGRERADSTDSRVLRGGSWYIDPRFARAAYRLLNDPGGIVGNVGFRVARSLAPS
jgi:formylglycine-generating enzyme required for sulfatase activity